jgi:hypothetical protein
MSLWAKYETDEQAEQNGVEIKPGVINDNGTEAVFLVARIGGRNYEFTRIREQIMRPYQREVDAGTLPVKKRQELDVEIFCKANLKGWSNIYDRNNVLMPYSQKAAIALFGLLPDLYFEIAYQASKTDSYKALQLEDAEKNS